MWTPSALLIQCLGSTAPFKEGMWDDSYIFPSCKYNLNPGHCKESYYDILCVFDRDDAINTKLLNNKIIIQS